MMDNLDQLTRLPPELWDLILTFLSLSSLEKIKLISRTFLDLITLNRNLKYKLFLYRHVGDYGTFPVEHAEWIIKHSYQNYAEESGLSRLDILRWIYSRAGSAKLTEDDKDWHFIIAAKAGHLDILKWVYSTSNSVRKNLPCPYLRAFVEAAGSIYDKPWASEERRLMVLKWLHFTFNITKENITTFIEQTFRLAVKNEDFKILQWLYSAFNLKLSDIKGDRYNYPFIRAAERGNIEILKWINSTFGLTIENSRQDYDSALRHARYNRNIKIIELIQSFYATSPKN